MLMQVFSTGMGRGAGPVDYVTGELGLEFEPDGEIRRDLRGKPVTYIRDPSPVVVAGNPDQIEQLIDSLEFKYKYSSGVLSFAHEDGFLSDEKEAEIINDFEKTAFAGLDVDQYSILWTRHTHQGRHELHFIIPRVELSTGKSLNVFPPNYQKYFDPWRSLHNERNGWADPDDPARSRLLQGRGHHEKIDAAALRQGLKVAEDPKKLITDYLVSGIESGVITDRDSIIKALEAADLEINRQGKDYISIRPEPDSKPIRLKGPIYEQHFNSERFIGTIETQDSTGSRAGGDPNLDRISELERDIAGAISRRIEYNRGRYQKPIPTITQEHRSDVKSTPESSRNLEIDLNNSMDQTDPDRFQPLHGHLFRELGPDALDYAKDFEQSGGDRTPDGNTDASGEAWREDHPQQLWREETTLRPDRRERTSLSKWLQSFKNKVEVIYDAAREAIDRRFNEIIRAIRSGTDAAEATDRAFDEASSRINQACIELERTTKTARVIMENRADELDKFKTNINLVEYASIYGYQVIKRESGPNSKIMEKDGDKIVVATGTDGHGIYFSVHDKTDSGSIIDFIQKREGLNLGQVRKVLRVFSGLPEHEIEAKSLSKPVPTEKNAQQVLVTYTKAQSAIPRYLTNKRGIDEELIKDHRFSSVIRVDANKNAVFPHFNKEVLCGFELKNDGFTGFAKGGSKGLWLTSNLNDAKSLIICESAIDALSHAQIKDDPNAAYASIGGSMSDQQPELIKRLFKKLAERQAEVVIAVDNDQAGRNLSEQLHQIAAETGVSISLDIPKDKDWNQELMKRIEQENNRGLR